MANKENKNNLEGVRYENISPNQCCLTDFSSMNNVLSSTDCCQVTLCTKSEYHDENKCVKADIFNFNNSTVWPFELRCDYIFPNFQIKRCQLELISSSHSELDIESPKIYIYEDKDNSNSRSADSSLLKSESTMFVK